MTYDTSAIKSVISCRELCENNGIAVNSKGKARCVFHDDAHASMHVYDDGVHCFSCGAHTDVIGLAQELYGVNFPEACRILAEQYGIAPESSSDWKRKADEQRRKRLERQKQTERLRDAYFDAIAAFRVAEADKERYAPRSPTDTPDERFFPALDTYNAAADKMRRAEWALLDAERK